MTTLEKFEAAVQSVQNLPKTGPYQPSNELKLRLYCLFKQATEGPCTTPKPGLFNLVARAKWNAWNNLENLSSEEAMTRYVEEILKIVRGISENNDNSEEYLSNTDGPFFKFVQLHENEFEFVLCKKVNTVAS